VDLAALVDAYWDEYRQPPPGDDVVAWPVWFQVDQLLKDDEVARDGVGVDRVTLLVALADAAPDTAASGYLGAGPIENHLRYQEPDIDRIDEAARRSVTFRDALRNRARHGPRGASPDRSAAVRHLVPSPKRGITAWRSETTDWQVFYKPERGLEPLTSCLQGEPARGAARAGIAVNTGDSRALGTSAAPAGFTPFGFD
jgi:hypothetical protein